MKKKLIYISTVIIVLAFFVIGLFFDLSFAKIIYNNKSVVGMFFAAIGETPAYGGLAFIGGGLIAVSLKREKKAEKIALIVLAIIVTIIGTYLSSNAIKSHNALDIEKQWYISLPIAILICGGCGYCGYLLTSRSENPLILKTLFAMLISIAGVLLTVTLLKKIWARPRPRFVDLYSYDLFRNWWELNTGVREKYMELGVISDEFKSCPSGHSSSACLALLLMYLPHFDKKYENKEHILFLIGIGWTFIVAFTRLIMGAHFITDVTFAIMIAMIIIFVTYLLMYKINYEKRA